MNRRSRFNLLRFSFYGAAIVSELRYALLFDGTEFAGGSITGPLNTMNKIGVVTLFFSFSLIFIHDRAARVAGVIGALACLPIYGFFLSSWVFYRTFGGEWSVPMFSVMRGEAQALIGMAIFLAIVCLNVIGLPSQSNSVNEDY